MFSKTIFLKSIAVFLAFNILQWSLFPAITLALTSGSTQPEYTSYEANDATDMVNLMTGDFTYNLPVITIPGPEGSCTLPLAYHAGIGPEQEASWVGLGWNINPGAITRNLNQYPDDAKGSWGVKDIISVTSTGAGPTFWEDNYLFFHRNWDSETGKGGSVSLLGYVTFGWGNSGQLDVLGLVGANNQGVYALGVTAGDEGVKVDAWGVANAAFSIFTFAMSAPATSAMNSATQSAVERTVFGAVQTVGVPALFAATAPPPEYSSGYMGWKLNTWKNKRRTHGAYMLNQTRHEVMYGSLYLGDILNEAVGSYNVKLGHALSYVDAPRFKIAWLQNIYYTHDMSTYLDNPDYGLVAAPTHIAYDGFSVMGSGITGNIQPYRLETGSLSYPIKMTENDSYRQNIYPFLKSSGPDSYKVNFKYASNFGNRYEHQKGIPTDPNLFGINASYGIDRVYYDANDPTLVDPAKRIEEDRLGLKNKRLVTGRHIEWFTNAEIASGVPMAEGKFMDFLTYGNLRTNFRNGTGAPDGIGGFSITAEDGTTYHYALPVLNKKQSGTMAGGIVNSEMTMKSPYAVTWLLTAITGSDFVDRGNIGLVDDEDWGFYVKYEYGKFASNYHWRMPYWTYGQSDNTGLYSVSQGLKETYYLNSIETRSHTALFIKELRTDGRAAYARDPNNATIPTWDNYNDLNPSSSLKLSEIILLKKEDYKKLVNTYTFSVNSNTANGVTYTVNGDTYNTVFDKGDIGNNEGLVRQFLNANQLKKVVFNYDYSLCGKTINSFGEAGNPPRDNPYVPSTRGGKLTLKSVSVLGANNVRLFPDVKYDYDLNNNPDYGPYNYDGWGMYKPDGTNNTLGHRTKSNNAASGAAWLLKKITNPLGGTIEIDYERDSYSSVCGEPIKVTVPLQATFSPTDWRVYPTYSHIENNLADIIHNGEQVEFVAKAVEECPYSHGMTTTKKTAIPSLQTVTSLNSNSFVLSNPPPLPTVGVLGVCQVIRVEGHFIAPVAEMKGGDIRVSQIKTSDGFNTYKTRYIYTQDGLATGVSSGVVSKEPTYINSYPHSQDNNYDYPSTPVLYGKVTVLNGVLATDSDYTEKVEYSFETPNTNHVKVTVPYISHIQIPDHVTRDTWLRRFKFLIENKSNNIGRINSVKKFDKNFNMAETNFNYEESTYQGIFLEGSLLSEQHFIEVPGEDEYDIFFKLYRTEKRTLPSFLKSITNKSQGITSKVTNTSIDFFSGAVLEKEFTNSLGVKYHTVSVPAYERYPQMGSKALDPKNKNMMSQTAAEYLFKNVGGWTYQPATLSSTTTGGVITYTLNLGGYILPPNYRVGNVPPYGIDVAGAHLFPQITEIPLDRKSFKFTWATTLTGSVSLPYVTLVPVNVAIQSWDNQWRTREYSSTNGLFFNKNVTDNIASSGDEMIWRKKANYVWKSPLLNSDGTYQAFVDYKWTPAAIQHQNWQETSNILNYNQFSMPLESKDISGNYSSVKMGYDLNLSLTSAQNANYDEVAYSGAEDLNTYGNTNYFGSEVGINSGVQDNTIAHTGKYSLKLPQNSEGFSYKALISGTGIEANKKYRASVWIYDNGNSSAKLSYSFQNQNNTEILGVGGGVFVSPFDLVKAGNWILLNLDIVVPSGYEGNYLVVKCSNYESTPAYFDDFRFHPLNTSISCNVYDQKSGLVTHVLDGDGFYVRYEYDAKNRIKTVYKETIKGEKKTTEYKYNSALGNE